MMPIKAIFVDIGNTLGTVDLMTKTLTPFADMLAFLKAASRLFQVPIGVITDIPESWENAANVANACAAGMSATQKVAP
jgi:hypothetical protein